MRKRLVLVLLAWFFVCWGLITVVGMAAETETPPPPLPPPPPPPGAFESGSQLNAPPLKLVSPGVLGIGGCKIFEKARKGGVPRADQAYGTNREFRQGVRDLGLHYAVAVDNRTVVTVFDTLGRRREEVVSVRDLAHRIAARDGFRRCTWRQGTSDDLSARFALRRVVPAYDGGPGPEHREPVWLLIEWRDGEDEPANYFFCSLPERLTKKKLVRIVMQRWRTERAYQDLKDELGLDHYEGRRFPGWHHHVSVFLCCYAFVIAERVRHFPPSAGRPLADHAQSVAA